MKVSKKLVVQEAAEIKEFTLKNKKLPKYATINGSEFSPSQYCYVLAKQISKMSLPTVNKITVKEPTKSSGDTVNFNIYKNDYVDLALRVANYMELHKQAPNYATYNGKYRIKFELYTFCFSKILAFYKENGYLPNYCLFKSSDVKDTATTTLNTKKTTTSSTSNNTKTTNSKSKKTTKTTTYISTPHYLTENCNRLGQCTPYFCGPHSIHQAIRKFGITKYDEKKLASWCGTTTSGTDHPSINSCIAKVSKETGIKLSVKWKNFSDMGKNDDERFKAIGKLLADKNTAIFWHILYKSSNSPNGTGYGHYEMIDKVNTSTRYVRALNSLGSRNYDGSYVGRLQDRTYSTQSYFARNTPSSQPALCIITKG